MLNNFVFFFDLSLLLPYFEKLISFDSSFSFCISSFIFLISFFLNSFFLTFTFFFFFDQPFSFCFKNQTLQLIPFTCMHYLFASSLRHPFVHPSVHLLSLFLFLFSRFYHMCFLFHSFVFSVYDLFVKHVFGNFCISGLFIFCKFVNLNKNTCLRMFAFLSLFFF